MSITKAKKNQIIDYMLEKISNKSDVVGKTAENFMPFHYYPIHLSFCVQPIL